MTENFHLKWNDYTANIISVFQGLREDTDHVDVTLSCYDGQLHAHKVILSASSPIFRDLLRRNNIVQHNHPIIFLRGVRISDLRLVLDFVYRGEVSVAPEDVDSFLSVGQDLRIKGLTENSQNVADEGSSTKQPTIESSRRSSNPTSVHEPVGTTALGHAGDDGDDVQENIETAMANSFTKDQLETEPGQLLKTDQVLAAVEDDDAAEKSSTHHLQDFDQYISTGENGSLYCGICKRSKQEMNLQKMNLKKHIEAVHFPNTFSYRCQDCLLVLGSYKAWENHKKRKHPKNRNLSYVLRIRTQENISQSEKGDEHKDNSSLYDDDKKEDGEQDNNSSRHDDSKEVNKHENNNTHDEEESPLAPFKQHTIQVEGEERKYRCKICSVTSPRMNILLEHVESNHFANTVSYHCPICGKNFGTYAAYRGHTYDDEHRNQ